MMSHTFNSFMCFTHLIFLKCQTIVTIVPLEANTYLAKFILLQSTNSAKERLFQRLN